MKNGERSNFFHRFFYTHNLLLLDTYLITKDNDLSYINNSFSIINCIFAL